MPFLILTRVKKLAEFKLGNALLPVYTFKNNGIETDGDIFLFLLRIRKNILLWRENWYYPIKVLGSKFFNRFETKVMFLIFEI